MKAVLFITAILLAANESRDIWVNLIGIGLMALLVVLFNHKKTHDHERRFQSIGQK